MAINWIPQKVADQHKSAWLRMTSNSIGARFIVGLKKYSVSSHKITCMWIQQEHHLYVNTARAFWSGNSINFHLFTVWWYFMFQISHCKFLYIHYIILMYA